MEIIKINTRWQAFLFERPFKVIFLLSLIFQFHLSLIFTQEAELPEGITVDLRHPEFSEGILRTSQGGVIKAEGVRFQARQITYIQKIFEGQAVCNIEAAGDLQVEFGEYIFVGDKLTYDFIKKTGVIFNGKTALDPWFIGGKTITLNDDESYTIYDSFLTTSENSEMEWKISAEQAHLYRNLDLEAKNFKLEYQRVPLFWLPKFRVNLNYIKDFPIRYSARWGGRQGPRVEFLYEIFSWKRWKTFLKFDYRLTRGPGIGFETYYRSEDHREIFEAINYIARDSSLNNPHERFRYRFQGNYMNSFFDDKITLNFTYDKLSDRDMATDYSDSGLNLEYPGATALRVRRQAINWIANLRTNVRLNTFQTIRQELPTAEIAWKPFNIGSSDVITNRLFKASYLDFQYAKHIHHRHDYNSPRIQYSQQLYRSFRLNAINLTPELGGTIIYYGNLPKGNDHWLLSGNLKCTAEASFYKKLAFCTHTLTPYAIYNYYTLPTSTPHAHYIFDINDGLYELNMLRFGTKQNFFFKTNRNLISRPLNIDLYANAFFDSKAYHKLVPKVYYFMEYYSTPWLKHSVSTAWDFEHGVLDHFNLRTQWTHSADLALSCEYRHRSPYDFRKADPTNFMLEAYRSPHRLKNSALSDRRDTLLLNMFYRFHPLWALGIQSRHGWNRKHQPNYTEFGIDLLGKPHAAWQLKFSYQHCENDKHRFTVYFNMGIFKPDLWKCEHLIPQAAF